MTITKRVVIRRVRGHHPLTRKTPTKTRLTIRAAKTRPVVRTPQWKTWHRQSRKQSPSVTRLQIKDQNPRKKGRKRRERKRSQMITIRQWKNPTILPTKTKTKITKPTTTKPTTTKPMTTKPTITKLTTIQKWKTRPHTRNPPRTKTPKPAATKRRRRRNANAPSPKRNPPPQHKHPLTPPTQNPIPPATTNRRQHHQRSPPRHHQHHRHRTK
mmetsp:Transcript_12664/g.15984  ORF Transcript_12664/g.15984 Transcript_12664/m.15984 type:complete len:213 (+) Transcript_12664:404-1042(+)